MLMSFSRTLIKAPSAILKAVNKGSVGDRARVLQFGVSGLQFQHVSAFVSLAYVQGSGLVT